MGTLLQTIALHDARFMAYHGFYPEEQLAGGIFMVDVQLQVPVKASADDHLPNTIDYERIYNLVKAEMAIARKLIETVAENIMDTLKAEATQATVIIISIRKISPPLAGEVGSAEVKLVYHI